MRTLFDLIDDYAPAVPVAAPKRHKPKPAGLADRITPRPYQAESVAEFFDAYAAGERHFLDRLATGCGKTIAAALKAERWLAIEPDRRRVMVIACEQDLVHQLRDEFGGALGCEV